MDPRFRRSNVAGHAGGLAPHPRVPAVVIAEQVRDPRWIVLAAWRHVFSWCTTAASTTPPNGGPPTRARRPLPVRSTVWETISCQNGCESFIRYAIVCLRRVYDMASPDITAGRQDIPRMGRRRVSSAARRVGTRLVGQPLTDRGLPATLTISRRSAGVIPSSPRPRVAQAAHHKQIGS
jgi:hypothetical protein